MLKILMRTSSRNSSEIFAMSQSKKTIAANLDEITCELCQHLIKLYLYPDSVSANHWKKEIYNYFHSISTFKNSHKLPSKDFILNNTIKINEKFIITWINVVKDDYSYNNVERLQGSNDDIKIYLNRYFEWISERLSNEPLVSKKAIYDKLDELIQN